MGLSAGRIVAGCFLWVLKMHLRVRFCPRIIETLRGYKRSDLMADLGAGLTVGVVALPLAMAFAIASGAPPQAGLVTAVIAGFMISALGGTRLCIGGPTGAFVIILQGILLQYGWSNLVVCTIMAGVILVILGASGLGRVIKFMPFPVTMGFTSGIAILIMSTQVQDFFGLTLAGELPHSFFPKMGALIEAMSSVNWIAAAIAIGSFALIRLWPRAVQRIVPGPVAAILLASLLAAFLQLPVETIGSRFGDIPRGLPAFDFPEITFSQLRNLIAPATTIALLAAIESLLCAVVADGMTDDRHNSDQELVAQGLANIVTPLFGGLAATSAIARTATNIRSGARTPVAGIIHAGTLMAVLIFAAPYARYIPLAALSAILLNVALHMGEWRNFRHMLGWPASDAVVFLTAFCLTVVFDLTIAVQTGVVLAALMFIKRISQNSDVSPVDEATETEGDQHSLRGKTVPDGVLVFRMKGALFFGAASKLETILERVKHNPRVLILRMRKVVAMDASGVNALQNLLEKLNRRGSILLLSAPQPQPLEVMQKSGFVERLGEENLCPDIDSALRRADQILAEKSRAE